MFKKTSTILLIVIVAFLSACQSAKENKNLQSFSEEYTFIKNKFNEKAKNITTREQYIAFQREKTSKLEELLKKYDKAVSSDEAELLKSKLLVEISRFKQAEEKIDYLINKESNVINEAKLVKVQSLIYQQNSDEALKILKSIEKKIEPGLELLSVYLYFALYSQDNKITEEYANKFLNSTEIPRELSQYKANVYRNLSAIAMNKNDLAKARKMLEKGILTAEDRGMKLSLEAELEQLQLIGKTAPTISAETWINSFPLALERLKGKVVVIDFWATWCHPCRLVIPWLIEQYNKHKDKGLVVIGLTKLYGDFSDDTGNKGRVSKAKEIQLLKTFVQRYKIPYPLAIAVEGINSEKYKVRVIPTMVFINRKGEVDHIKVGAGNENFIEDKIIELLEEK